MNIRDMILKEFGFADYMYVSACYTIWYFIYMSIMDMILKEYEFADYM